MMRVPSLALAVALTACTPPGDDVGERVKPVEPRCAEGDAWSAGTSAFVERTDEMGLIGVLGQRISAADLDGDGDADLIVRRVAALPNDTSLPFDERTAWLLRNDGGAFVDVSEESGLFVARGGAVGRPGEVMAFADVDNDGDLDVYAGVNTTADTHDGETSEIWLNDGDMRFELVDGGDVRRVGDPDLPASASFVDVDRNGDVDLFVGEHNYGANLNFIGDRLYMGLGTGAFVDETDARGAGSQDWTTAASINGGEAYTRTWAGIACDLNDDGDLELMTASYGRAPNHLFQAVGDGTFANVSVASGFAFDDDQTWQDNEFAKCFCEQNPAAEDCDTVAEDPLVVCDTPNWNHDFDREPFRNGGNNATTVCADFDKDGDLDLATTTIRHWWAGSAADMAEVLENVSSASEVRFERPGREAMGIEIDHGNRVDWDEGIMTAAVFDFDNDARIDLYWGGSDYPGNRGMLYRNVSDGALAFEEVSTDDFFAHNRSHGVVAADFDRDGDLDVVVGHSQSRCGPPNDCYATTNVRYFENTAGANANWVQVQLEGTSANRSAIGARVTIDGQVQEVGGGYGHFGAQNEHALHFGLGETCGTVSVTVRWPDADLSEETFEVASGWRWRLVQGGDAAVVD